MRIVVLDGHSLNPGDLSWKPLERLGELTVYGHTYPEEVIAHVGDTSLLLLNKTSLTAQVIEACPSLSYVGVLATGYNSVDLKTASAHGVTITNVPGYSTPAVAQHTIALLLELCNHVALHSASVAAGDWQRSKEFCYWKEPLVELAGKTIGLVGLGSIGSAVAGIAKALGMRVITTGSRPTPAREALAEYVSLNVLLEQSDVVSLHCPLTPENHHLICSETIDRMKPGALLINTARGRLVNEADLAQALQDSRLGGAAVDVVSTEPIVADNPLLSAPRCIITPHLSWATRESRQRLIELAADNLEAFLAGTSLNVVNKI